MPQHLDVVTAFPATVRDVVRMGRYGELGWLRRFAAPRPRAGRRGDGGARPSATSPTAASADLSGGERQRTLLAQAIAQDAELLLLDEPLTGIDAPTHDAIGALLARAGATRGGPSIVATHDLEAARPRLRPRRLPQPPARRVRAAAARSATEETLAETFAGHVVRVGSLLVDVAHHHHGAG